MRFSITVEDLKDEEILCEKLTSLASIVFRKHFYVNSNLKDDLMSVGVLKAISLIKEGRFTNSKGTILNYLYTGMRNDMHNYVYHSKKDFATEFLDVEFREDIYFSSDCFKIDVSVIEEVCKFFFVYGNLVRDVIKELIQRGFDIVGSLKGGKEEGVNEMLCKDFKDDLIDRLCGAVLWKSLEYSRY